MPKVVNLNKAFEELWANLVNQSPASQYTNTENPENEQLAKINKLIKELDDITELENVAKGIIPELFPKHTSKTSKTSKGSKVKQDKLCIVISPWIIPAEHLHKIQVDFHTRGCSLEPTKCPNCAGDLHTQMRVQVEGAYIDINLCLNCHIIWGNKWSSVPLEHWENKLKNYLQNFGFVPEYRKLQSEKLTEF